MDRLRNTLVLATLALAGCGGENAIESPTPLFNAVPIEYPVSLWDRDVEGETLVRVKVSDTGAVVNAEVLESSGYEAFDSAAVSGAMKLRFEPARRGGERIEVWARVPVVFSKRPVSGGGLQ